MRLNKEIFTGEVAQAFQGARGMIFPCGEGYFEGVKALGDFSTERVVLRFPHCEAVVEGEGLHIGKYLDGDLYLTGRIFSFFVNREGEK